MKLSIKNLLKFNLCLGRWKKIKIADSNFFFYNRYIFKINDLRNSIIRVSLFLNTLLKLRNKILFLGSNPYTAELIENLAITSNQLYVKPWGYGVFTNPKLYRRYHKSITYFWKFKPSAVLIIDPTNLDIYFKEIEIFNIPIISIFKTKSTYFIQNSLVAFNTVSFYIKFLRVFLKKKKCIINFYRFKNKKIKLLKKFKKIKTKKRIFLNKIRYIRVRMIRKSWYLPYWRHKVRLNYAKKNKSKKFLFKNQQQKKT